MYVVTLVAYLMSDGISYIHLSSLALGFIVFWIFVRQSHVQKPRMEKTFTKASVMESAVQSKPATAPLAPISHLDPSLVKVGLTVRVIDGGSISFRAMALTVDHRSSVAELLTVDKPKTELEATLSSLFPLEDFEAADTLDIMKCSAIGAADALKAEGRVLFGRKDYRAASERYRAALRRVETHCSWRKPQSGAEGSDPLVLVRDGQLLRPAEVLAVRAGEKALVSYVGGARAARQGAGGQLPSCASCLVSPLILFRSTAQY